MPLHLVSSDKTSYLPEINQSPHWTARPWWPGTKSCYLIVLTHLACTGLFSSVNLPVRLTALRLLTARINHRAHFLLSPRQHVSFFFSPPTATSYLCPANSLACQSPSGWISLSGSTCLSPLSSVCDAPMDLQGTEKDHFMSTDDIRFIRYLFLTQANDLYSPRWVVLKHWAHSNTAYVSVWTAMQLGLFH